MGATLEMENDMGTTIFESDSGEPMSFSSINGLFKQLYGSVGESFDLPVMLDVPRDYSLLGDSGNLGSDSVVIHSCVVDSD